jgi:Arc/MetJ family transcription regulator
MVAPAPRADRDVDERLIGHHEAAIARAHRAAGLGHDLPAVELAIGHAVGDAQRLDRRGERDHREVGHEQEGEAFRRGRT